MNGFIKDDGILVCSKGVKWGLNVALCLSLYLMIFFKYRKHIFLHENSKCVLLKSF